MARMNKMLALLLAVLMLVGLAACGGKGDPAVTQATNPGKGSEPVPSDPADPEENLTIHENTFFTVGYREADGWTLEEGDVYLSDYGGSVYLRILNDDGHTGLLVFVEAYEEEASSFRSTLHANGVDMKAYVEGTWVSETIGGVKMAAVEKEDGEWYFFGRDEAAGVSYTVRVTDREDPNVPALIRNISFTAPDAGKMDPPWPWEGEPISGGTRSQLVGGYTLTAQFIPQGEPMVTYEVFAHDIAVVGDKVYLLSDGALYQYWYDGASLQFIKEIPLPGQYDVLEKGADGKIVLSGFMEPVFGHDGESAQFAHEGPDQFTVAPDGTWGISWFVSGEKCERYVFQNSTLVGSAFPFYEVDTIGQVCIDSNYILVCGSSKDDGDHYVFVYDHSGVLQMRLGGEPDGWGLGSITYVTSTPNGFLALDGNMREVVLWTADGTWIGNADDSDLFGTDYPWFASADLADDGSVLVVMADERPDQSADEVLVFKLSGF